MAESRVEHVMGMPVRVEVCDAHVEPWLVDRVFAWLRWVDATFSTYRPSSEIRRLESGALARREVHPCVAAVLDRCGELREQTQGYFDVRAAADGRLDPSGLVKGWSVERAGALLRAGGARRFCVNAGGDLRLDGGPAPGRGWRVGVRHPRLGDHLAAVLSVTDAGVATSGAYERGEHVFDPHTGRPPAGVLSVTVVGPDLATADAYATAAFAMGEQGPAWTAGLDGYDAMTILADDRVLSTPGFLRHCAGTSVTDSLTAPDAVRCGPRRPALRSGRAERSTMRTTILVLANQTAESDVLFAKLEARAAKGRLRLDFVAPPAGPGPEARAEAGARLDRALERAEAAGWPATGVVGTPDALTAVIDAYDAKRHDEIIVSTLPPSVSHWLGIDLPARIARATNALVTHVAVPEPRPPVAVRQADRIGR